MGIFYDNSMMKKILCGIWGIFFVWFLIPVFAGIINIGNLTGLAVFAVLYYCTYYFEAVRGKLKDMWQTVKGKILLSVCTLILSAIFLTAAFLGVKMIQNLNTVRTYNGETVVVLGCEVRKETPSLMLLGRIKAAYQFLNEHPEAQCVLSGGMGNNENISEAEAMYRWLTEHGIDSSRLYKEDRSASTIQNLQFSREIILANHLNPDLVIITSGFHEYRAELIADTLDLKHFSYGSVTPWWLMPTFVVREMYGILYQYVIS